MDDDDDPDRSRPPTMMVSSRRCCGTAAALFVLLTVQCQAFAPHARFQSQKSSFVAPSLHGKNSAVVRRISGAGDLEAESLMKESVVLTPEGTGFSSPISRIVKLAGRGDGCCRSKGTDRVIDVMEAITQGIQDVALVFDEETNKLLGIFTETDYIRVSAVNDSFFCLEIVLSCETHALRTFFFCCTCVVFNRAR